jgi:hypothetical protein
MYAVPKLLLKFKDLLTNQRDFLYIDKSHIQGVVSYPPSSEVNITVTFILGNDFLLIPYFTINIEQN